MVLFSVVPPFPTSSESGWPHADSETPASWVRLRWIARNCVFLLPLALKLRGLCTPSPLLLFRKIHLSQELARFFAVFPNFVRNMLYRKIRSSEILFITF